MTTVRCLAPTGDRTGEGAVWIAEEGKVYWTDINRFLIHALVPGERAVSTWFFDEPVVALAATTRPGTLLVALASKLTLWQPANDARGPFGFELADFPHARLNDGRADPAGRFWVGSMGNNIGPDGEGLPAFKGAGKLFRLSPDGAAETVLSGIGISNTLVWSPDRSRFYFADTLENEIRVYDYDEATGAIGPGAPFFAGFERGAPDGSAMDVDGYLWNCRWGGGCIVRIAPDGSVDRVIEMPTDNITTCTFGGPELTTLLVTTAESERPTDRLAGSLFGLDAGVAGLPENRVRID